MLNRSVWRDCVNAVKKLCPETALLLQTHTYIHQSEDTFTIYMIFTNSLTRFFFKVYIKEQVG